MISIVNLTINFPGKLLFKNVNLTIQDKDRVGLIGKNGSGKTTLLKAIGQLFEDYEGQISTSGNIVYLDQFRTFDADTPYEYYMKKADTPEKERMVRSILKGLGFEEHDWNRSIESFSGGEKTRLHLGRLFLETPDFILLDEPTNFLDIAGIHYLKKLLSNFNGGYIIISHDRSFLRDTCTRFLEINNEKIWDFRMPFDKYLEERKRLLEHQERELKNRTREIERLKTIIERYRRWGREKSLKQAKSKEKRLQKMLDELENITLLTDEKSSKKVKIPQPEPTGYIILEASKLGFKNIINDVSFTMYEKDKVAILGPNGSGKTTILKLIIGKITDRGKVSFGHNVTFAFLDQFVENLNNRNTVFEEISDEMPMEPEHTVRAYIGRFGFRGEDVFKMVNELSGGEKQILALAKILLKKPNLLILDEPTNHMDLETVEILEKALKEYKGSIMLVSHDEELIKNVCNRFFAIKDKKLVELKNLENYDTSYTNLKTKNPTKNKENNFEERKKVKNQIKKTMQTIEKLKKEEEELSQKLSKTIKLLDTVGSNYQKAMELTREKETLELKILEILETIETLEEKLKSLQNLYENITLSS
ncbi:ATP-binding cassette domain-containing protein [Thermosipho ferrireducens]|uniref:ATP-binding cassette domain-containing protein n=1 Tax=Thermosipho ferrireducens TaxID=2571116 RepID=A0ABX7SAR8_9BACT|nr:ABC-F family ATP-binding cassette domain-containing protein [Thermosipho ferrireducens]QTA38415.1 ATP-binding cassette domain-containing protein [Thermosipho ferrireducens]